MAFPFYGADGTSGTVAVSNGNKNVTGTGTNWLSNNAVPTAGGYAIKMPDGQIYGIDACTGEGSLHLVENYNGSTVSGGAYYIMPVAAAIGKLLNDVSALLNSSSYSQLAGLSPSNGDYVQYVSGTWATRTPLQSLLSLLNSMSEVNIASASTTDIGASTSPKVQITGTTTITGLGSQANAVRFVRFGGALTLTHNSSSLILPGATDITTASGDTAIFSSDGSGNWRCYEYQRASGQPIARQVLSVGTATNDDAAAGQVGEHISSGVPRGTGSSYTSGGTLNITSISLTTGDWHVSGFAAIYPTTGTITQFEGGAGTTSATFPTLGQTGLCSLLQGMSATGDTFVSFGSRLSLSAPATVYLMGGPIMTGAATGYGYIAARRER